MKRIQKLHLRNFKAFRDQRFDFDGQHVLIYGGNGSGKSSVYWALYTLFEASRKTDIAKYFVNPDTEPQSLRHADALDAEPSFIRLSWYDPQPPSDPTTGAIDPEEHAGLCLISSDINDAASDRFIQEADITSDFVNYRLFQHFNGSNRDAVNVWPAFVRDIFPYYTLAGSNADFEDANGKQPDYLGAIAVLVAQLRASREALKRADEAKVAAEEPRPEMDPDALGSEIEAYLPDLDQAAAFAEEFSIEQSQKFNAMVETFNQAVSAFINRIAANTNHYLVNLNTGLSHAHQPMRIQLRYAQLLSPGQVAVLADDIDPDQWISFLRRDEPNVLSIELRVWTERTDRSVLVERPQTFLNEARLTRLAFALRMGALLDRNPAGRFNILCLDDILLSLDMGNRMEILNWLFSPQTQVPGSANQKLLDHYQVFFFTHDRELYRMLKHYISRPHSGKWRILELVNNEHYPKPQPSLLNGDSNDYFNQAWKRFHDEDFPACANYLRKETERLLEKILPLADRYQLPNEKGETLPMPMGTQLGKLQQLFTKFGKRDTMGKLEDLELFKQILLNPLSHDSFSTTVYQSELYTMLEQTLPELQKMKRRAVVEVQKAGYSTVYLKAQDYKGIEYTYTIELRETLWEYTFPDGSISYSHPACQVLKRVDAAGNEKEFTAHQGTCADLADGYEKICFALGELPTGKDKRVSVPAKPLRDIITLPIH